jgi:hypothetical protein
MVANCDYCTYYNNFNNIVNKKNINKNIGCEKNMKKVIKSFGIGAAVLMLCLAAMPAVYGAPLTTLEDELNISFDDYFEKIEKAIYTLSLMHPEEVNAFLKDIAFYFEENGNLDGFIPSKDNVFVLNSVISSIEGIEEPSGVCYLPVWKLAVILALILILYLTRNL